MSTINIGPAAAAAVLIATANNKPKSPSQTIYDGLLAEMVLTVKEGVANAGGRGVENASTVAVPVAQDKFSALKFKPQYGFADAANSPTVRKDLTNDLKRLGINVESIQVNADGGLNVSAYQKHNLVTGAVAAFAGLRGAWLG
ncbi:MAG: hypothetical protein ACAI38_10685 [Myxococcota bacterium]